MTRSLLPHLIGAMVVVALVFGALGFIVGSRIGFAPTNQPNCPHEDSCTVDYHDGAWHITPNKDK